MDGYDIRVVELLVANGGRNVAQQPQRDLPFHHDIVGRLREQPDPVLKVLLTRRSDELKYGTAGFLARLQQKAPPLALLVVLILPDQRQRSSPR